MPNNSKNKKTHCINGHLLSETGRIDYRGNRYCVVCRRENQKRIRNTPEWKAKNNERNRENVRKSNCKKLYGISFDDALRMFDKQNGKCLICGDDMHKGKRGFCIDHDHKTGKVRGILCSNCNTGLGMFKDNISILQDAISYLNSKPRKL